MTPCDVHLQTLGNLLADDGPQAADMQNEDLAALDAHLSTCATCRRRADEIVRIHRALHELAADRRLQETATAIGKLLGETERRSTTRVTRQAMECEPLPSQLRTPRYLITVAATVMLTLTVGGWLLSVRPKAVIDSVPLAKLEQVRGEVYRIDGERRILLEPGDLSLRSGQGLQSVGEESSVAVVYSDGTRVEIGPDSLIESIQDAPEPGAGKRVLLTEGFVSAEIHQPADRRPMSLVTPHATVELRDTRLNLVNLPTSTRVEVEAGSAVVQGRGVSESLRVDAGCYSVISEEEEPVTKHLVTKTSRPQLLLPEETGRALAIAFSPDGKQLAAGGRDGTVRIWEPDLGEGQTSRSLRVYSREEVRSLAFSPDGNLLAVGGDDRRLVKLIDLRTNGEVAQLNVHRSWIETLTFTADGRTLIVAGAHGQESSRIYFWNVARRTAEGWIEGHAGGVWALAISPDGRTLAGGGRDGLVKFWDVESRQLRCTLDAHDHEVTALAFSPDGERLISGSKDRTAKIWHIASQQLEHQLVGHPYDLRGVVFTPDGTQAATTGPDGSVRIWDVGDGREIGYYRMPQGGSGWSVAVSPNGKWLVSSGTGRYIKIWDRAID